MQKLTDQMMVMKHYKQCNKRSVVNNVKDIQLYLWIWKCLV